ncbi:MAG: ArsA family ATPase [Thermovibrio sp.]|nr:MAG: ArsA family ATPase [Thermovibrio sp.]
MFEEFETFFFSGKGGVGKSTVSSAVGVRLSEMGFKTLVVSLDPAHSLSLTFKREIGGKITRLAENLYGLEIDVDEEVKSYLKRVKREAKEFLSPVVLSEIEKQIELAYYSPGALDLATLDLIHRVAVSKRGDFEKVIFDTAPSGYTVRMLSAPEITEKWIEGLIRMRREALMYGKMAGREVEGDRVVEILEGRLRKIKELRSLIFSKKTLFSIVVNPQELTLEIGKRTVSELESLGINVGLIVVNKVESEEQRRRLGRELSKRGRKVLFIDKRDEEPRGVEKLRELL